MINYKNILTLFNYISAILIFVSSIIIFTDIDSDNKTINLVIGSYNLTTLPLLIYFIINKYRIENLLLIKNIYYFVLSFLLLNFGIILMAINHKTIGCGIIIIINCIYSLIVGIFSKDDLIEDILNDSTVETNTIIEKTITDQQNVLEENA